MKPYGLLSCYILGSKNMKRIFRIFGLTPPFGIQPVIRLHYEEAVLFLVGTLMLMFMILISCL